jgi:DNA-directed RNA polymerase specialized sigma24 family protein
LALGQQVTQETGKALGALLWMKANDNSTSVLERGRMAWERSEDDIVGNAFVSTMLSALPAEDATVLAGVVLNEYSYQEVAVATTMTHARVRSRLASAKRVLRPRMT